MDLMLLYDIIPAEKASLDLNKLAERLVSSIWKYDKKHGLTSEVQKIVQEIMLCVSCEHGEFTLGKSMTKVVSAIFTDIRCVLLCK